MNITLKENRYLIYHAILDKNPLGYFRTKYFLYLLVGSRWTHRFFQKQHNQSERNWEKVVFERNRRGSDNCLPPRNVEEEEHFN